MTDSQEGSMLIGAGRRCLPLFLAAAAAACALTLRAQESPAIERLAVGRAPGGVPQLRCPAGTWVLAKTNRTDQIDAAFKFRNDVVVFGWSGLAGQTTIIDARTGDEELEFLGYFPRLTPEGLIVFERFYPHFTDPFIISDRIAALDLNQPVPHSVPGDWRQTPQLPTDSVGADLYPRQGTPDERHLIGSNFLITDAGKYLFILDARTSGGLCVVRLTLDSKSGLDQKQSCLTAADLGVPDTKAEVPSASMPWKEVHISGFAENTLGELVLSLELGPPPIRRRDMQVSKTTLAFASAPAAAGEDRGTPHYPWPVRRATLLHFVPLDLQSGDFAGHLHDRVKISLISAIDGHVREVSVSGTTDEIVQRIEKTVRRWTFAPAVYDRHPAEVLTEFRRGRRSGQHSAVRLRCFARIAGCAPGKISATVGTIGVAETWPWRPPPCQRRRPRRQLRRSSASHMLPFRQVPANVPVRRASALPGGPLPERRAERRRVLPNRAKPS